MDNIESASAVLTVATPPHTNFHITWSDSFFGWVKGSERSPNVDESSAAKEQKPDVARKRNFVSKCFVCDQPAGKRCGQCKQYRYCSASCQQVHWAEHKVFQHVCPIACLVIVSCRCSAAVALQKSLLVTQPLLPRFVVCKIPTMMVTTVSPFCS